MHSKKKKIVETIVVEGKTDSDRLKSIFDVQTIETKGSSLNKKVLDEIISISQKNGIILFLDPDNTGEQIRKKIMQVLPNAKNCFLKKSDIKNNSKKIGLAEAKTESIIEAIENACTFINDNFSLSWNEYISFELDTKLKREKVCNNLKISYCNFKQLFKRLNMMGMTKENLKKIVNSINK
ncbi:MAG: ribonuclease M5 [Mycoplasma sp.]|nr:ribonuclease M5 [Mycoplasma sp.]